MKSSNFSNALRHLNKSNKLSDGTIGILFYLVLPSFADAKNSTEEKKTIQKRGRKSVKLLYAGVAIYS